MNDKDIILEDIESYEIAIKNDISAIWEALKNFEKRQKVRNFESDYVQEKINNIKVSQHRLDRLDVKLKNIS